MNNLPKHVAIIPDGNRRWARERGMLRTEGHRVAYKKAFELADYVASKGVDYLTFWAFSTENWKRDSSEVNLLLALLRRFTKADIARLHKKGFRVRFFGSEQGMRPELLEGMRRAEELTAGNEGMTLNIGFNYGGRRDLVEAVAQIVREGVRAEDVNEKVIAEHLSTHGTPPPDLVIRTSGELRTSGYMTWEAAYAELIFFDVLWPDFGEREIDQALEEFARRQRRYGS
jgi:undecaprenyl diphosphate synthase